MKTPGVLLFFGLLILWAKLPSALGQKPRYTWVCPPNHYQCIHPEPDYCKSDLNCKGGWKCCESLCRKRCVEPVQEKYVISPPDFARCSAPAPNLCTTDSNCKGDEKCCFSYCALRCVPPLKEKPGFCPLDPTVCLPGGPVLCHGDNDCPGAQKCCSYECVVQCKDPAEAQVPAVSEMFQKNQDRRSVARIHCITLPLWKGRHFPSHCILPNNIHVLQDLMPFWRACKAEMFCQAFS